MIDKKNKFYFIEYLDKPNTKTYCYKAVDDYEIGDIVEVERSNQLVFGKILDIKYYSKEEPYLFDKLKKIIRKVDSVELRSEEEWKDIELKEYHDLLLNSMFGKLQIKRFMNILKYPIKGANLYFYPKFNTFFYKDENEKIYIHAEYETEVITQEMYRIIEKESIKVDKFNEIDNDNKLYTFVRKFCIDTDIDYYDDTDILEFNEEKEKFNTNKKKYEEPKDYESIDEIIKDLEEYKKVIYVTPDPAYYIENDRIIHNIGFIDYQNPRIFNIPEFLLKNNYIDNKYYNIKDYPELFDDDIKNYNYEILLRKRLSYVILRSFNIERINEGTIDSMCRNGYMLRAVKRLRKLGKIKDNEEIEESDFYDIDAVLNLTPNILKTLKYEDVLMMSFAEPGAMGRPGEINFYFKNNRIYTMNYCYDHKLKIEDLFELFPPLSNTHFFIDNVSNLDSDCEWLSMGFGNYLIVKKSIYDDFKELIDKEITEEFKEGELYNRWVELAKKFNSNNR